MGLSKSFCTMESWCKSIPPPQAETSTEGSGVTSPISEPGRKATVLTHKDLAVGTFGVHDISCGPGHNFNRVTGGLSNDLVGSDPGGTQFMLSGRVCNIVTPTIPPETSDLLPWCRKVVFCDWRFSEENPGSGHRRLPKHHEPK